MTEENKIRGEGCWRHQRRTEREESKSWTVDGVDKETRPHVFLFHQLDEAPRFCFTITVRKSNGRGAADTCRTLDLLGHKPHTPRVGSWASW